ncbi:alpha/beta fold hydrolase [Chitinophaga japonensis]|uniref:Pimeloyl-ACP methyl ester carboxylesterase n=1 Tax=Chitinophaga japonensis TaxID=104662 RepID=A0A562SYG5_CHIJA|nr:alpha/beta hydrolase [Chitinophaga japonensis]TWI86377.1 pimeloyl-ACP methyl ester carboxylesterase [Chitinophaga japonensis]
MKNTMTSPEGAAVLVENPVPGINGVSHQTVKIGDLDLFYREAGPADAPVILLLHGFPTSSHMFRNLMIALGHKYRLIAPDYPGFGNSSMPPAESFEYSFDHLAEIVEQFIQVKKLEQFSLYVMDYGAPVGYRIATRQPSRVQALPIQNGNAYEEGLAAFWDPIKAYWQDPRNAANLANMRNLLTPEATKWQYLTGVRNAAAISPDNWIIDQAGLDRPGNDKVQLDLFYSYRTNLPLYPQWQEYFRTWQPPALITWGKGDEIFPVSGAYPYQRDLKDSELHILDTGHFALEEDGTLIAGLIDRFLSKHRIG